MSKERTEDWNLEGIVYIINIVTVFLFSLPRNVHVPRVKVERQNQNSIPSTSVSLQQYGIEALKRY